MTRHQFPFELPLFPIEHPRCLKCGIRTTLVRISPCSQGLEQRTFECPTCNETKVIVIKDDPMEAASGWLASQLKPSE